MADGGSGFGEQPDGNRKMSNPREDKLKPDYVVDIGDEKSLLTSFVLGVW